MKKLFLLSLAVLFLMTGFPCTFSELNSESAQPKIENPVLRGFGIYKIKGSVKAKENGRVYYTVNYAGSIEPLASDIIKGTGVDQTKTVKKGSFDLSTGVDKSFEVNGLTADTKYDFYFTFVPISGSKTEIVFMIKAISTLAVPKVNYEKNIIVANGLNDSVEVSSTAMGGIVLIKSDKAQSSYDMMKKAIATHEGVMVAYYKPGGRVAISTKDLVPGIYYGYSITPLGKLSEKSAFPITVKGVEGVALASKEKLAERLDQTDLSMINLSKYEKDQQAKAIAGLIDDMNQAYVEVDEMPDVADVTVEILSKLSGVIKALDPESEGYARLKSSVFQFVESMMDRVSIIEIGGPVEIEADGSSKVDIQRGTLDSLMKVSREQTKQIMNSAMNLGLGAVPTKESKQLEIVIDEDIEGIENVKIVLSREILDDFLKNNYAEVVIKVKGVALTLPKYLVKGAKGAIAFKASTIEMPESILPKGVERLENAVAKEFTLSVAGKEVEFLEKPTKLAFSLLDMGLTVDDFKSTNSIFVHVFNEKKQVWEAVSGKYDPVDQVIVVYRLHMSKYSLLKSSKSYSDLENEEAKDTINSMLGMGTTDSSDTFNPEATVTREEFVTWVTRTFSLDEDNLTLDFDDISEDDPNYKAIANAYNQGLITGKSSSAFDPKGEISREEMATLLGRVVSTYYEYETTDIDLTLKVVYGDENNTAEWASTHIQKMLNTDIMKLDKNDGFRPTTLVKKAEAAEIINRLQNF